MWECAASRSAGSSSATLIALPATSATRDLPSRGRSWRTGRRSVPVQRVRLTSGRVRCRSGLQLDRVGRRPASGCKTTRACAYDRLGEGKSDAVRPGVLTTADRDAKTLRSVLAAAHIEPPFILVAHSWAGAIAVRFAYDYRDTVSGVVLVDSQQADVIDKWLAMLPPAPKHGVDQFAQVRAELKRALKPLDGPEHFDVPGIPQLHQVRSLGSVPLVVLTAERASSPPRYRPSSVPARTGSGCRGSRSSLASPRTRRTPSTPRPITSSSKTIQAPWSRPRSQ